MTLIVGVLESVNVLLELTKDESRGDVDRGRVGISQCAIRVNGCKLRLLVV